MIKEISSQGGGAAAAPAAPVAAAAPVAVAAAAPSSGVSPAEATRVVLAVLANKTGYEPDMIEMDMALETELGVDSIKRVEILSEVQKQLSVEAQDVAALSRTQTVGEVVDAMLKEIGSQSGLAAAAATALAASVTGSVESCPAASGGVSAERAAGPPQMQHKKQCAQLRYKQSCLQRLHLAECRPRGRRRPCWPCSLPRLATSRR